MKKLLLASSAAVALTAAPVAAQAAEMSVGGWSTIGVWSGGKIGTDTVGLSVRTDSELTFHISETLDDGMTVGAKWDLESTGGADEAYVYAESGFGKVIIGSDDSAAAQLAVGAGHTTVPDQGAGPSSGGNTVAGDNGDEDKIVYISPDLGGAQVGISYAPDASAENTGGLAAKNKSEITLGANWSGDFDGISVTAGLGYANDKGTDLTETSIGVKVSGFAPGMTASFSHRTGEVGTAKTKDNTTGLGFQAVLDDITVSARYRTSEVGATKPKRTELAASMDLSDNANVGVAIRTDDDGTTSATVIGVAMGMWY